MDAKKLYHFLLDGSPTEHPTVFVVARIEHRPEGEEFELQLVDPQCPERGAIDEYLSLNPAQRVALEVLRGLEIVTGVAALHASFDELRQRYPEAPAEKVLRGLHKASNHLLSQRFLEDNDEETARNEDAL